MEFALDPTKALHTWSLFDTMGRYVAPGSVPSGHLRPHAGDVGLDLLDLPAQLRAHGFSSAQLCHFYLPSTDASYLAEVRHAFAASEVDIEVFLIDDGDVLHPEHGAQNVRWLSTWIDVADSLGCRRVRVPAGDQPPSDEMLELSATRLRRVAQAHRHIRVLTENWLGLLVDSRTTRQLLDLLDGEVGLLIDTGNWSGADKYAQIAEVAGRAEASQIKVAELPHGSLDRGDLARVLGVLADTGYSGRLSLVHEGSDSASGSTSDEWSVLDTMYDSIRAHLDSAQDRRS